MQKSLLFIVVDVFEAVTNDIDFMIGIQYRVFNYWSSV